MPAMPAGPVLVAGPVMVHTASSCHPAAAGPGLHGGKLELQLIPVVRNVAVRGVRG